jgi:uncharacterized OB-fold protein
MSPFVEGLKEGALRYQACNACQAAQTLTRHACRRCGSTRLEWRKAAGRGIVYATTVVSRAPCDDFRALVPYALALVDLEEGARVMGHAAPGIAIGERVVAGYFELAGRNLIRFRREP